MKKLALSIITLLLLPLTILRVVIATTLIADLWADKIIIKWMDDVDNQIKNEK